MIKDIDNELISVGRSYYVRNRWVKKVLDEDITNTRTLRARPMAGWPEERKF